MQSDWLFRLRLHIILLHEDVFSLAVQAGCLAVPDVIQGRDAERRDADHKQRPRQKNLRQVHVDRKWEQPAAMCLGNVSTSTAL
jgi:hypothetical protein